MRKMLLVAVCAIAAIAVLGVPTAEAQDTPPVVRYVASTSFNVAFGPDRGKVISFLEEYFLPGYQLNPKVLNFRMLNHNWGSNGSQIILVAEYATFADIEADCGEPCETYFAQHEAPEEGEAGYAEYREKSDLFSKYYSTHSDEIYSTPMRRAVVEGEMQGTAGPTPPADM